MAMPIQSIALLLSEHQRDPFVGPVLTYGMQGINVSMAGAKWLLANAGLAIDEAGLDNPPDEPANIDFARMVRLLGLGKLRLLDVSDYEDADIVLDLNTPVPDELKGQFGFILDGGTLEHVFDIRQGLKNTADMLRPGGRVFHLSPCNNYINHGFMQMSPTLYHDYYTVNGFDDVRGFVVVHPRDAYITAKWNFYNYDHAVMGGVNSMVCDADTQMAIYFTARKTATSSSDKVPVQSYFSRFHDGAPAAPEYQFRVKHSVTNPIFELIPPRTEPEPAVSIRSIIG